MKKTTRTNCVLGTAVAVALSSTSAFVNRAWLWYQGVNRIGDHIEAVNNIGLEQAFENNDLLYDRLRFAVFSSDVTEFGVYVGFENIPSEVELNTLRQSGVIVEVTCIDDADPAIESHKNSHRKSSATAPSDGFLRGKLSRMVACVLS